MSILTNEDLELEINKPVLEDQGIEAEIVDAQETETGDGTPMLNVTVETRSDAAGYNVTDDGELKEPKITVAPGHRESHNFLLKGKGNFTDDAVKAQLLRFATAVFGKRTTFESSDLVGKMVRIDAAPDRKNKQFTRIAKWKTAQ